jgi:hypothetical protein
MVTAKITNKYILVKKNHHSNTFNVETFVFSQYINFKKKTK